MSKRSRDKGKRGERLAAKLLSELGINSHRGQQYNGLEGEDVVSLDLATVHWEVKHVETLSVQAAMRQSEGDALLGQIPAVLHKKNNKPWLLTIPADRMLDFAHAVIAATKVSDLFDD